MKLLKGSKLICSMYMRSLVLFYKKSELPFWNVIKKIKQSHKETINLYKTTKYINKDIQNGNLNIANTENEIDLSMMKKVPVSDALTIFKKYDDVAGELSTYYLKKYNG